MGGKCRKSQGLYLSPSPSPSLTFCLPFLIYTQAHAEFCHQLICGLRSGHGTWETCDLGMVTYLLLHPFPRRRLGPITAVHRVAGSHEPRGRIQSPSEGDCARPLMGPGPRADSSLTALQRGQHVGKTAHKTSHAQSAIDTT